MENNSKKRVTVDICGNSLSLVTDEPEEFVKMIAKMLDNRMSALTKNNFRTSATDAALLCAIEAVGDKLKAERRVRSLEAQADLYEVNLRSLREELEAANAAAQDVSDENSVDGTSVNGTSVNGTSVKEAETISAALKNDSDSSPEDKIRALEKYLESKKSPEHRTDSAKSREEKIRYIESLLRGNDEK